MKTAAGAQRACVVSIKDLYSRKVLAWQVSNTMGVSFCIDYQGRKVHQQGLREHLEAAAVRTSQTGKGRAADNGQMRNLWYSLKYEGLRHVQAATWSNRAKR